jgi:hypothetical protein
VLLVIAWLINMNNNKRSWLPLSSILAVAEEIDQLLESLQAAHKSEKSILQLRENANSILHFEEQIFKWKQETQNHTQQQLLGTLEKILSKASILNFKLLSLKEKEIDQKLEHIQHDE